MKYEIHDRDVTVLSPRDVAEQLMNSRIEGHERIGEVRLECGCDLEIDIHTVCTGDPRIEGCLDRTETFSLGDICEEFTYCNAYVWAKDDNGDDVLLGFL